MKKLYRNSENAMIAGVCSGIADYFGIDPILVRLIFVLGLFTTFPFILMYIIIWIITPEM